MGILYGKLENSQKENSGLFCSLPTEIIETICKLLASEDNIEPSLISCNNSLNSLSSTCQYLHCLIRGFEVKYPLVISSENINRSIFGDDENFSTLFDVASVVKDLCSYDYEWLLASLPLENYRCYLDNDFLVGDIVSKLKYIFQTPKRLVVLCSYLFGSDEMQAKFTALFDYFARKANLCLTLCVSMEDNSPKFVQFPIMKDEILPNFGAYRDLGEFDPVSSFPTKQDYLRAFGKSFYLLEVFGLKLNLKQSFVFLNLPVFSSVRRVSCAIQSGKKLRFDSLPELPSVLAVMYPNSRVIEVILCKAVFSDSLDVFIENSIWQEPRTLSVLPEICTTLSLDWRLMSGFIHCKQFQSVRVIFPSDDPYLKSVQIFSKLGKNSGYDTETVDLKEMFEMWFSKLVEGQSLLKVLKLDLPNSEWAGILLKVFSLQYSIRVIKLQIGVFSSVHPSELEVWENVRNNMSDYDFMRSVAKTDLIIVGRKLIRLKPRLSSDIVKLIEHLDGLGWEILQTREEIKKGVKRSLNPNTAHIQLWNETSL